MDFSRRMALKVTAFVVSFVMVLGWTIHPASASNTAQDQTVIQKRIMLNAVVVSDPSTFIYDGTTYVPILNIADLFRRLGIRCDWTGQTLYVSTKITYPDPLAHLSQGVVGGVYVNGKLVAKALGRSFFDPKILGPSIALPLPPVMRALQALGIRNTWNGAVWNVSTYGGQLPFVTLRNVSDIYTSNQTAITHLKTTSTAETFDDKSYWRRADSRFYIRADSRKNILQLQSNQPLSMTTYLIGGNVNGKTRWVVNSPDGIVRPGTETSKVDGFQAAQAVFVAKKPGIYTVQAESMSLYSIPLVIVVGLAQLPHHQMTHRDADAGIRALPRNLPTVKAETVTDVTYNPYAAQNGWLPVYGVAKAGTASVVVDLSATGKDKAFMEYQLPTAHNGSFSGMVRIPFTGQIRIQLFTDMFQQMDTIRSSNEGADPVAQYTVVNTVPTTEQQRALFATNFLDYNMNAAMVRTAETLYENSPSKATAIQAISHFVAEKVLEDRPEEIDQRYSLQLFSANGTWNLQMGSYRDINHLTAAMLRSVGIPTELCWGTVGTDPQYYTWLHSSLGTEKVMGNQDITYDPLMEDWLNDDGSQVVGNVYFGSGELNDTHQSLNGRMYTFYEGIY